MPVPRIVIVDDDRQVSHMLRSSLRLTGEAYTIVDVPSGEEAILEISRGGADLVVTDLRLPGIPGLDMLEKVRESYPDLPSIVITGNATEEARIRAKDLGVIEFLPKPIRTSRFLEAVNLALRMKEPQGEGPLEAETAFIAEWLLTMQRELGAVATLLLDRSGEVLVQAGDLDTIDLRAAMPNLMTATEAGLKVSRSLGDGVPANLMYFDGEDHDVYLATVGEEHALAVVFPAKGGAAQIGAVLQYSRRAAEDLLNALYNVSLPVQRPEAAAARASGGGERLKGESDHGDQERGHMPDEPAEHPEEEAAQERVPDPDLEKVAESLGDQDPDSYWDEAARTGETGPISNDTLSYDEARKRGLLSEDEEA